MQPTWKKRSQERLARDVVEQSIRAGMRNLIILRKGQLDDDHLLRRVMQQPERCVTERFGLVAQARVRVA